jgi:hypothetical protein
MISDLDILRAAYLMIHEFGGDAELEAAKLHRPHAQGRRLERAAHLGKNPADDRYAGSDDEANRPTKLTETGLDYSAMEFAFPRYNRRVWQATFEPGGWDFGSLASEGQI